MSVVIYIYVVINNTRFFNYILHQNYYTQFFFTRQCFKKESNKNFFFHVLNVIHAE